MPTAADIHVLGKQAVRELDAAHDFFEHSKLVWRSFLDLVKEGNKVTHTNLATATTVTQDDLVRLAQTYSRDYLTFFTFQRLVSIFESFVFDLLRQVLLHNPWQLARKQVEFSAILHARDRAETILSVLNKELNELRYQRPGAWFEYLNRAVRLDCPSADEIEAVSEIKATRDIWEHNAGVANSVYEAKAGSKGRFKVGESVEIPDEYYRASWMVIRKVANDLSCAAISRLAAAPA